MPGFTSLADLLNQITANGYEDIAYFEKTLITGGNGAWISSWAMAGLPAAGATPATTPGTVYTSPVAGAIGAAGLSGFPAVSAKQRYGTSLSGMGFAPSTSQNVTVMIADRLVAVSGISLATATTVTVSSTTLPRYTSGLGVQAWLEITTALSTTAPIVNLASYSDDTGGTGLVGSSITAPTATLAAGNMIGPLPLASAGSSAGVKAVSTLTVGTAAATGVCNLVLLKPLCYLSLPFGTWVERDLVVQSAALPRIFDGACLMMMAFGSLTGVLSLQLRTAYE